MTPEEKEICRKIIAKMDEMIAKLDECNQTLDRRLVVNVCEVDTLRTNELRQSKPTKEIGKTS
jgi:hypothetical protein